jgi:hypothetical protein
MSYFIKVLSFFKTRVQHTSGIKLKTNVRAGSTGVCTRDCD